MPLYKFEPNDVFVSRIKTHPQVTFHIYDQKVFINNNPELHGENSDQLNHVPVGHANLYELNVDRPSGSLIYPFVTKDGSVSTFRTISTSQFNSDFQYGDTITGSYPMSASISKHYFPAGSDRTFVKSIKNSLNYYVPNSPHYKYTKVTSSFTGISGSTSGWDKDGQALGLIDVPSIFYGSSIKKGSVKMSFYATGTLIGKLEDTYRNGALIETTGSNVGEVAGVVLYNEGFIMLTGSWDITEEATDNYLGGGNVAPKWPYFAQSISSSITARNSSFELSFNGTQYVSVVTMLAHANRGRLNYSNNTTFIKHGQDRNPFTGSVRYVEPNDLEVVNMVSSSYYNHTSSLKKQTYISRVAIYDKNRNLIATANLANPVKKSEELDLTFKMKYDF